MRALDDVRFFAKLDKAQDKALTTGLTNELALIQGPPGTGKTYVGEQIVKALLKCKEAWRN